MGLSTRRLRAEHGAQKFYNKRQNEPIDALAGDGAGTVDVADRLNWIYVRPGGDSDRVTVAYNKSAYDFAENDAVLIRWVKRTGLGYYEVTGYSGAVVYDIDDGDDETTTQGGVKYHAWQHEWWDQGEGGPDALNVHTRMLVQLRAQPQQTPDLTLYVNPGPNPLTGTWYAGGNSGAFSPPVGLASAQIDILYLDDADALQIQAGTPVVGGSPAFPTLTPPAVPLAAVYLQTGQTTITEDDIYRDVRMLLSALPGAPAGGGHTIQDEGTPLTQRTNLNFVGAGVTATDDAGNDATVVTIPGGGSNHDLLDGSVDQDTVASTVTRGDLIVGNATPKWDDLAIGTARQLLAVNAGGTDPEWASFDWDNAAGAAGADMVHDHSAAGEGNKLAQANTHESADTDAATSSLHHTIGAGATNAAAGNHTHSYSNLDAGLSLVLNDGGIVLTTGAKLDFAWPWSGTITGWDLMADLAGDLEVDILDAAYASFPGSASSIWGTVPALSGSQSNQASGLSIAITKGHWAQVQVTGSPATITRATLALYITRS